MIRTALFLVVLSVLVVLAMAADQPKEVRAALERKLVGAWIGGACIGELNLAADGTFERHHYSPGNNHLTGTWEVHRDTLPSTLVLNCKTSDDLDLIGKVEVQLIQLDDAAFTYQFPGGGSVRFTRVDKTEEGELAAIQGTWFPRQYEEAGKRVRGPFDFKQFIKGDKVTFQVNGETKADGTVVLDPTKNPKQMDFQFSSGQTDLIIYVRVGDYITYCGNRDGKTRPTEFVSGTAKGGEYLMVWKIAK
jgi:uncharacterized protein (TIGR03067 family)